MSRRTPRAEPEPIIEIVIDQDAEPFNPVALNLGVTALLESLAGVPVPRINVPPEFAWLDEPSDQHIRGVDPNMIETVWDEERKEYKLVVKTDK